MIKSIKFEFNLEEQPFQHGDTPMSYARRMLADYGFSEATITDVSVDVQLLDVYQDDRVIEHHVISQILAVEIQVPTQELQV